MDSFQLIRGSAPLLISLPHDGSRIPPAIAARLVEPARAAPDTDWFVSRLYDFARELGASMLVPVYSRYVIDLNRPEDDVSLYPGQNTTGLCPTVQFSGEPVYEPGKEPTPSEITGRIDAYWRPYHEALASELDRLVDDHGRALLWEGHSIRSRVPFLFEGRLPDINLGTAAGASCGPERLDRMERILSAQTEYSWISNGRFKGGYITRHYGRAGQAVEAVQLELAQCNYMDEETATCDPARAARVGAVIRQLISSAMQ